MKRATRSWWMMGIPVLLIGAILFIALSASQATIRQPATLESIYDLLITEDGENRLDLIEQRISALEQLVQDIDDEVDLIYLQAKEMMEEEGWQFEKQQWTLDDMKFLLDTLADRVDCIYENTAGCP